MIQLMERRRRKKSKSGKIQSVLGKDNSRCAIGGIEENVEKDQTPEKIAHWYMVSFRMGPWKKVVSVRRKSGSS
jgi:hypothetical protein